MTPDLYANPPNSKVRGIGRYFRHFVESMPIATESRILCDERRPEETTMQEINSNGFNLDG